MNVDEVRRRAKSQVLVCIDREMGWKLYFWFPALTPIELEAWWLSLEDVETFGNIDPETKVCSYPGWPGDIIEAHASRELSDLWNELADIAPYYASIFWNLLEDENSPDTYLKRRDGTILLHRGSCSDSSAYDPEEARILIAKILVPKG